MGVGTAGYLVHQGDKAKTWAEEMQQAGPYSRELIESVQAERQLTLAHLAGDEAAAQQLPQARARLDTAFRVLIEQSAGIRKVDDDEIGDDKAGFATLGSHLSSVRGGADVFALPAPDAYNFYNRLLDVFTQGTKVAERRAPDATVAAGVAEGLRVLNAGEAMARSNALALSFSTAGGPTSVGLDELVRQVGFYHSEVTNLLTELGADERRGIEALVATPAWQQLSAMESALIARYAAQQATAAAGTGGSGSTRQSTTTAQPALPMDLVAWQSAAKEVNAGLLGAYTEHNRHVQGLAQDTAHESEVAAATAGGGVLLISGLGFLAALLIANRIIRRLRRLRSETLVLADERLPETMARLRDGEQVDAADVAPKLDFGKDEIGEVAQAFEHAAAAALRAAVDEARTREGVKAVFLNIAHRSQIVVHRQLEILDEAERRQEDPALLETLFRLDHLATRERRNAENLIILGGGRPGRQWRNPIPVMDVVRSAIGETLDYARVRVTRLPEVSVVGAVVADLVHLLAELVDNATSYSPPQSRVEAGGNVVGKGVVIEITDQGMGMSPEDLERYNQMLSAPPDFGVGNLSADSRLGLYVVARLAQSHGVSVRLSESDYGGVRAIVLIPNALIAGDATSTLPPAMTGPLRRGLPAPRVLDPVPGAPVDEPGVATVATLLAEPPAPVPPAPAPIPAPAPPQPAPPPAAASAPATDDRPALPRRTRQTNLAPELSEPMTAPRAAERPRTAEQARDIMSAIENGTRQGRKPLSESMSDEQEG
ncbi:sensor histidine kinase [Nocardia thailandica]